MTLGSERIWGEFAVYWLVCGGVWGCWIVVRHDFRVSKDVSVDMSELGIYSVSESECRRKAQWIMTVRVKDKQR